MSGLYGNKFLTETVSLSYDDFIDIYYDSVNESKYLIESIVDESVDLVKVKENIISSIKKLFNGFVKFVSDMFTKLIDFIQNSYNELSKKVNMKLYKDIQFKDIDTAVKKGWKGVSVPTDCFRKIDFDIDFKDDDKNKFIDLLKNIDRDMEKINWNEVDDNDMDIIDNLENRLSDIENKLSKISNNDIVNKQSDFVDNGTATKFKGSDTILLTEELFVNIKKYVFDYRIFCKKYRDNSNSIIKDMKSKKDKLESELRSNERFSKKHNDQMGDDLKELFTNGKLYSNLYIFRYRVEIKYRTVLAKRYVNMVKNNHKQALEIYKECIKAVKQYVSSNNSNDNKSANSFIEITDEIKKATKENDILRLRIMLKDSLLIDRSFKQFDTYLKYANDNLKKDLFTNDDGDIDTDKSNWTKDYMNQQLVELVNCFSMKKINHIKEVITEVYKNK